MTAAASDFFACPGFIFNSQPGWTASEWEHSLNFVMNALNRVSIGFLIVFALHVNENKQTCNEDRYIYYFVGCNIFNGNC